MKKKSYKITKLEKNRKSLLTNNLDQCYLCGCPKDHLHEVYFGKNRLNSMKYNCVIPVCFICHDRIQNDINLDLKIKKEMQLAFQNNYDIDFISIFYRNYL